MKKDKFIGEKGFPFSDETDQNVLVRGLDKFY